MTSTMSCSSSWCRMGARQPLAYVEQHPPSASVPATLDRLEAGPVDRSLRHPLTVSGLADYAPDFVACRRRTTQSTLGGMLPSRVRHWSTATSHSLFFVTVHSKCFSQRSDPPMTAEVHQGALRQVLNHQLGLAAFGMRLTTLRVSLCLVFSWSETNRQGSVKGGRRLG
jgi:hypothetical protein